MLRSDFHYDLPAELIAAHPSADRGGSRLLVVRRDRETFEHCLFDDLDRLLRPGGLMVLSGILGEELPDIRPAAAERGWMILEEVRAGDWAALVVRKPSVLTPPVR